MSWISRIKLLIELSPVVAEDKQTQGTCQRIRAARKAYRGSGQTRQVVAQLGVIAFNQESIGLAFRNCISTPVIPQVVIGLKGIRIILLSLGRAINQFLQDWLSAFPDHFTPQVTARVPIDEGQDVDPVFCYR